MVTETTADLVAAAPAEAVFSVREDAGQVVRVTYGDQLARLRSTAAALAAAGVRAGDRVHLCLDNRQEFLDVWFATAQLGAILVPTNPQSSVDELRYVLTDARPRITVAGEDNADVLRAAGARDLTVAGHDLVGRDGDVRRVRAAPSDPAALLYTSGTTSRPKGVIVTHANYLAVGHAVARHLAVTAADRWLVTLPLFHANAQYYCTMSALVTGASVAVTGRFSASRWGAQADCLGATLGSLFAAPIRMILSRPPTGPEAALRAVLFAQNLSDDAAAEFERRFATRLVQLYGMTETVVPPTINPDSPARRWDSIGRTLPGVDLLLIGEGGSPVPDGQVGEIVVRGALGTSIATGYWQNPEATAEMFGDGGLRTGDLARQDPDGFYYFVDRAKDMIKRSGENISAGEVEAVAGAHPAVAECAVVGVPDPVYDEAVLLVAVLHDGFGADTGDDILAWCRARLADFKVPTAVRFATELPRTSVGKVRKAELRAKG